MGFGRPLLCLLLVSMLCLQAWSKPTRRYRYDADFLDSEIQRIRSGRAEHIEPNWTHISDKTKANVGTELVDRNSNTTPPPHQDGEDEEESSSSSGSSSESEEDYDINNYLGSSEEIDVTCAPHKGWHIRGRRCVPINCPGGPKERDFNTGECLYAPQQPRGRFIKPFQQWSDLNHVYRSSPTSTHFVRSMILMRKG